MKQSEACEVYRSALIETARGGPATPELAAHLTVCAECRERLDAQIELTVSMMRVSDERAAVDPPSAMEQLLLAEFRRVRKPVVRPMTRRLPVAIGAIAAMVIAGWLMTGRMRNDSPRETRISATNVPVVATETPVTALAELQRPGLEISVPENPVLVNAGPVNRLKPSKGNPVTPAAEQDQPFLEVPYTMPLAPDERADLIRIDLPVSELIAAGMPVGAIDPAARARADVIVGQDGRARAFRVISVSAFNTQRSTNNE
jgi:hypothetical protein